MRRTTFAVLALALTGCDAGGPSAPEGPRLDPVQGRVAFEMECAKCHASADGFDLAAFSFTDTTIIRRAVAHVDTSTALNIVAYIRTLSSPHLEEGLRLFQPRGLALANDVEFAVALFGRDAWPAELTTAALRTINPREVRIAVPLPVWSDEATNLDWMPDHPLPDHVTQYAGRAAEGLLAGYRAAPSRENLLRAVTALRVADRSMANAEAPCRFEEADRVDYMECFEIRRWASSLVGQHMVRYGMEANLGADVHDVWWDVGNAARKSRGAGAAAVDRAVENWASWMFLGWSFDPSRHPSVYTGGGFRQLGLSRHATFVAARSQVSRPVNSPMVYDDLVQVVRFAPNHWAATAAAQAFRHLIERLESGDRPPRAEQITEARAEVAMALTEVSRKVPAAERPALAALAQRVLELLEG